MARHGILYLRELPHGTVSNMPTDGEIERLIEEAYPGISASLATKEMNS